MSIRIVASELALENLYDCSCFDCGVFRVLQYVWNEFGWFCMLWLWGSRVQHVWGEFEWFWMLSLLVSQNTACLGRIWVILHALIVGCPNYGMFCWDNLYHFACFECRFWRKFVQFCRLWLWGFLITARLEKNWVIVHALIVGFLEYTIIRENLGDFACFDCGVTRVRHVRSATI